MEKLKVLRGYSDLKAHGIYIISVDSTLKFEQLIEGLNKYVKKKYNFSDKKVNRVLFRKVGKAVAQLKGFFEQFYLQGKELFSFVHGDIEVDLMAHALQAYILKYVPIDVGGQILIFLTPNQISRMDTLIDEIKVYLSCYTVIGDKITLIKNGRK